MLMFLGVMFRFQRTHMYEVVAVVVVQYKWAHPFRRNAMPLVSLFKRNECKELANVDAECRMDKRREILIVSLCLRAFRFCQAIEGRTASISISDGGAGFSSPLVSGVAPGTFAASDWNVVLASTYSVSSLPSGDAMAVSSAKALAFVCGS